MAQPLVGIGLVSLLVHDYDAAIAFFVAKLGFTLTEDSPSTSTLTGDPKRWVVVHPPNSPSPSAGLLLAQAVGDEQQAAVGKQWAGRVGLFLHVREFEVQYRRMVDAGVRFVGEARDEIYGRVVVWVDCVGNRWDLIGPVGT